MYNENENKPWIEIYENYYSGMSQRELEKRYDMNIRTIQRVCKHIQIFMITNPSSTMRQNWNQIKLEIQEALKDE